MKTIERDRAMENVMTETKEKSPTIVFYSPDMDFCVSLRLLFQGRYNMVTITDPQMLLLTVREFKPYLVIVDSLPTEKMQCRFEIMKQENPHVRILSFYVARFGDKQVHERIQRSVDVAFSKPIDLAEVTESIHELMAKEMETANA